MLLGEELAGTAEPRLDFVEDQRDAAFGAQLAHFGEISRRRDRDPGFALDRLCQKGDRVGRDGAGERFEVAERYDAEASGKRTEAIA